jgi:apolipoprotein N-acyltransferase
VFGYEITKPLPDANILVNLSNDAWYGQSIASKQHLQISQGRALETGRMMLRSTNTGATAIISPKGKVLDELHLFKEGVLNGYAQGYEGSTLYIRYGNYPIVILCGLLLIICFVKRKNSRF